MFVDFGLRVENHKKFVQRGTRGLHSVIELRELLHRVEQTRQQQHECNNGAKCDGATVCEPATNADHKGTRKNTRKFDEGEIPSRHSHALFVRSE